MSETKLKPCPDCGGEAKLESDAPLCLILHWVSCSKCGCKTTKHPNREKVIKEWNERWKAMKTPDRTPEEIKKGLECCDQQKCEECPYDSCGDDYRLCVPELICDLRVLFSQMEAKDVKQSQRIAELEASYSQVSKALCGKESATLDELLQAVEQVKQTKPGEKLICEITIPAADILLKAVEEVKLDGKTLAEWMELVKGYKQLEAELAAAKRERDAAAADAAIGQSCVTCLYGENHALSNPCMACGGYNNLWRWRGVCPKNTEVQSEAST